jgi:hypothetical protein
MGSPAPSNQPRGSVAVDTFITRLPKKALGAAVGAVVAGMVLADSQAQALVVTVNGQDWDVTTFTGSYNDNVSKFETAANGGVMPWWGSSADAATFASVVGTSLGSNNQFTELDPTTGPFFAERLDTLLFGAAQYLFTTSVDSQNFFSYSFTSQSRTWTWAQATLVPAAPAAGSANVPGPLPILGLAAAFGFSRKLRKRIKLHRGSTAVSTPPGA